MATQTIQFAASASWPALNVRLFATSIDAGSGVRIVSETVAASPVAATKGATKTTLWTVPFEDVPAGDYNVEWRDAADNPVGDDFVTLTLTEGVFPVDSLRPAAAGNVTVGDITDSALAKFATVDTGETTAADGSVAKIAQGATGSLGATEAKQDAILAALSGKVVQVTSRTINGTDLLSYIGDDDVGEDAQKIVIDDVGEVVKDKLLAAAEVIFGAGLPKQPNLITGTIDTNNITHADGKTTVFAEITSANKTSNPHCYTYHVKTIDDSDNEYVRIVGTIDLQPEEAKVTS